MIIKKILSFVASIISLFILQLLFLSNSISETSNSKYYSNDSGIVTIMYHRFNENKYPSTNVRMNIFKDQMKMIKDSNFKFYDPKFLIDDFKNKKDRKDILITIDDGFKSFYTEAWPYLKENKIPFILFVSTEPVGKNGYMTWDEIKEVESFDFAFIGHHSHTHEYLIDMTNEDFINDIETASEIFKNKIGYVPNIFSYPFGEFSKFMKDYISKKFDTAFGQHSGIIDKNKDQYELPRFPINEKYGDLKRFSFLINLLPLQYKKVVPQDKYVDTNNPPALVIEFFPDQKNLDKINCFSDEGNNWEKSQIEIQNQKMLVKFREKFSFRRGRINCSMNDTQGWRWFGLQFSVKIDN